MKAFLVSVVLFVFLIALTIWHAVALSTCSEKLLTLADDLSGSIEDFQPSIEKEKAEKLLAYWEEHAVVFRIALSHDRIADTEKLLARLIGACKAKDAATYMAASHEIIACIEYMQKLTFPHIMGVI